MMEEAKKGRLKNADLTNVITAMSRVLAGARRD